MASLMILWLVMMLAGEFLVLYAKALIVNVSAVAVGAYVSCVLEGPLRMAKCWGGDPSLDIPLVGASTATMGLNLPFVDLGTNLEIAHIDAGQTFYCASMTTGTLKCWGYNGSGELGLGSTTLSFPATGSSLPFVNLGANVAVANVSCGSFHACALLATETIKCWGDNTYGQLGLGVSTNPVGTLPSQMGSELPTVHLGTNTTVRKIHAGGQNTCALLGPTPAIKCWGDNPTQRLGTGSTQAFVGLLPSDMGDSLPVINLGTDVVPTDLGTGFDFFCAIVNSGSIKCWGEMALSQLGWIWGIDAQGGYAISMGDKLPFVDIGTNVQAVNLAMGFEFVCVLTSTNAVKCWGDNSLGQIGIGIAAFNYPNAANQMGDNLPSVNLGTGIYATSISAGGGTACALLNNTKVKCWGSNANAQLGICQSYSSVYTIGMSSSQMGNNLQFVDNCGPTYSPTRIPALATKRPKRGKTIPTLKPKTSAPTKSPGAPSTSAPTEHPTHKPIQTSTPTIAFPTASPGIPTKRPTKLKRHGR